MKRRRTNDPWLVAAVSLLMAIGMIMIFSASVVMANERYGSPIYFYQKQLLFVLISMTFIFAISRFDYNRLKKNKLPLIAVAVSFVLLVLVLIIGVKIKGATRWFNLGVFGFQPSEVAKISMIIYFADIFSRKGLELQDWKKGLLPHILILGLIIVLILMEKDLSTSMMICLIIGTMMIMSSVRLKHVIAGLLMVAPFAIYELAGYQAQRLQHWVENWSNPLGSGYQIRQSLIGIGSGGFLGIGAGASRQKYYFLPDSHTDFVFSILGEEFGFIGTTLVLLLFMVILWRGIRIARRAPNAFGQYLAIGITMNFLLYALFNAAVVTMVFPTTGVPMPFVSYGGSSLVFSGIAVGILMNIARHAENPTIQDRVGQYSSKRTELYNSLIRSR